MQQPVHEVEVQRGPERNRDENEHEPHRVRGRVEVEGESVVGVGPEEEHFVGGPDRDAARAGVEHVVPDLVRGEEPAVAALQVAPIELSFRALALEGVEEQMQPARHQQHQPQVPGEEVEDPVGAEIHAALERGLQVEPRQRGERGEGDHQRAQEGERHQVLQGLPRARGPHEDGNPLQRQRGTPAPGRCVRGVASFARRAGSGSRVRAHLEPPAAVTPETGIFRVPSPVRQPCTPALCPRCSIMVNGVAASLHGGGHVSRIGENGAPPCRIEYDMK